MAGKTEQTRRFLVVSNLTPGRVTVVPDDEESPRKELVIDAWDTLTIRDNPANAEWLDDHNMQRFVNDGILAIARSEKRVRRFGEIPIPAHDLEPHDLAVAKTLVCGSDEAFGMHAAIELERNPSAAQITYMRDIYPKVLALALTWLKAWGPPEPLVRRIDAIEGYIKNNPYK